MKAAPVFRLKYELDDGAIVEMVIWLLPRTLPGSEHPFKYRLYYGKGGRRLVGYDNEQGKGDHRHIGRREYVYRFVSPDQVISDFLTDVEDARKKR
jgi:hypothetical protein